MQFKPYIIFIIVTASACTDQAQHTAIVHHLEITGSSERSGINPYAHIKDIPLPEGFTRSEYVGDGFTVFLRNIELKKDKTVYLYNGLPKGNQSAQFAVLNISVGNEDLQQCADAVMRLRAEYFFAAKQYDRIIFSDNEGKVYKFKMPYTKENFTRYLHRVFGMCGSASLSVMLHHVEFSDIRPGDVLIRGGFPGHAILVMDVAVNAAGKKIYLLAQSYMPAQDIHVLVNPTNENLSPWYEVNENKMVNTPEYLFYRNELKRW